MLVSQVKKVLVSVIIPVYNGVKFIRDAVYTALNQSLAYPEFEVVVVDDGSTDDSWGAVALIRSMNEGRVQLIRKENGGPASALNTAIGAAKGEWIKWLSADDMMYPGCLEDLLWHIDKPEFKANGFDPKNTIYYTDYDIINEEGKVIGEFIESDRPIDDLWKLFFGNGSSSFIHKSVFDKCGLFDDNLPHSEDYEFWLRATMLHDIKMKRIPVKTIRYRRHPSQLTNKVGGSLDKQIKDSIRTRLPKVLHS